MLQRGSLPPGEEVPVELGPQRLITCTQNHDQVGNRPGGRRLHHLAGHRQLHAVLQRVLHGPASGTRVVDMVTDTREFVSFLLQGPAEQFADFGREGLNGLHNPADGRSAPGVG